MLIVRIVCKWFNDSSEHSLHCGTINLYIVLINVAVQLHCHCRNENFSMLFQYRISLLYLWRINFG